MTSCKRHDLDPWVYYRDILIRLPAMLPGASEEELSPCSHTAGAPPDCLSTTLCLVRPPGPTYVFRQTLTVELNTLARLADALGYDVVVNFNKRP